MTWASFLLGLAGPIALRVMMTLGFSIITFGSVAAALQALIDIAVNNWAGVPANVLMLASLAGIPQAIGIICGSFVARVSIWAALSSTRFALTPK
jgi:hypothetical protein